MELWEQAMHFCKHIETLTNVHCTMLDLTTSTFLRPPWQCRSSSVCQNCDAVKTHLYGAHEAQRWDGKYIYLCPRSLVFSAVALRENGLPTRYCLITGPFTMADEDSGEESQARQDGVPLLSPRQARSLNELVNAVSGYLTGAPVAPDVDSGRQAAVLQTIYDLSALPPGERYPVEAERQLQESIRAGDKAQAQTVLNRLVCRYYFISGTDLEGLKSYVRELLAIMSRGAMGGGADVNEIFSYCYQCEKEMASYKSYESLSIWLSGTMQRFVSFMFDLKALKHQHVIREITAFIQNNISEPLTLEQAAEKVYLSKSYFCRVLKKELGCTFTEYVNRIRVEESKKFLTETDLSISYIAARVGYEDHSYYTRIFRKIVGINPKKYRESHKDA